jgi:MSHA biogenesis protein MshP
MRSGRASLQRTRRHARRAIAGRRPAGFALVTAIFLLVVLAAFAAFAVTFAANAAATAALAVQGVRAYEAARAGIEWAAYQVKDPNGTLAPGPTNLPDCFASPTALALPAALGEFTVTVTCQRFPAFGAAPNYHEEGNRRSAYYVVVATASFGVPGAADYVERRLEARIEKCKDAAAAAPAYAC